MPFTFPFSSRESTPGSASAAAAATAASSTDASTTATSNTTRIRINLGPRPSIHTKYSEVQRLLGPIELIPTSDGKERYARPCWRCYFLDQPCIKKTAGGGGWARGFWGTSFNSNSNSKACEGCQGELGYCNAGGSIPRYVRPDRMEDYLNRSLNAIQKCAGDGARNYDEYVPPIAVPMQRCGKVTPIDPTPRAGPSLYGSNTASAINIRTISSASANDDPNHINTGGGSQPTSTATAAAAIVPTTTALTHDIDWRNADRLDHPNSLLKVIEAYNHWYAESSMRHSSVTTALTKLQVIMSSSGGTTSNLDQMNLNDKYKGALRTLALSVSSHHTSNSGVAHVREMVRAFEKQQRRRARGGASGSTSTSASTSMNSSRASSVVSPSRSRSRSGSVLSHISDIDMVNFHVGGSSGGGSESGAGPRSGSTSGSATPRSVV